MISPSHPWKNKKLSARPSPVPPPPVSMETVKFFSPEPIRTPTIIREFEVRIDYRPISGFFRERGLERSMIFSVMESSELAAETGSLIRSFPIATSERSNGDRPARAYRAPPSAADPA